MTSEEVEETCFGKALVQRARSDGQNPVYHVLGQTMSGRYLLCMVIQFPDVIRDWVLEKIQFS